MRHVWIYAIALLVVCACALLPGCSGRDTAAQSLTIPVTGAAPVLDTRLDAPAPEGVDPALWRRLQAALREALAERGKVAAAVLPQAEDSRVYDFGIAADTTGAARAAWTYRNPGDYSQNGLVDAGDLAPLAIYFGETEASPGWALAQPADGNGDGQINAGDAVAIAMNFGHGISGYIVQEANTAATTSWSDVQLVSVGAGVKRSSDGRLEFSQRVAAQVGRFFRVTPYLPGAAEPGLPSNVRGYYGGVAGQGAWPMPGGDPQRSSFSATPGPAQCRVRPMYDADTGEWIGCNTSPVLTGDGAIIVCNGAELVAYERNGVRRWDWGDKYLKVVGQVAVADDGAFFCLAYWIDAQNEGEFYELLCFSSDGRLRWRAKTNYEIKTILPAQGQVFVGTTEDVQCFNTAGQRRWSKTLPAGVQTSLALDLQGGLYCADGRGLYKYAADGTLLWEVTLPSSVSAGLVVRRDGLMLVPTEQGLLAYEPAGTQRWHGTGLPYSVRALAVAHTNVTFVVGDPDQPAMGRLQLRVWAADGTLLRQADLDVQDDEVSLLLDSADRLYLHTKHTGLHCLKPNGAELYSFYAQKYHEESVSPCALDTDGALYYYEGGHLYCLAPDGLAPLPGPALSATDGTFVDHVRLNWTAVDGAQSYRVCRDGNPAPLIDTTALAYDDYGVLDTAAHSYTVHAVGALGKGDASAAVQGRLKALPPGPAGAGDWAMYGHDTQRTCRAGVVGTLTGQVRWTYGNSEHRISYAPVSASDGTLYVSYGYGGIEALTPARALKWRLELPCYLGQLSVGSDGTLYFGTSGPSTMPLPPGSPPPAPGGVDPFYWESLYVQAAPAVSAVAPDRTLRWRTELPASDYISLPDVTFAGTAIYSTYSEHAIAKLSPTGELLASKEISFNRWVDGLPALSPEGNLYSLGRTDTGRVLLQLDAGLNEQWSYAFTAVTGYDDLYPWHAPAIAADGTLFLTGDTSFAGLPGASFTKLGPGGRNIPPALTDSGRLYVANDLEHNGDTPKGLGYCDAGGFVKLLDPAERVVSNLVLDAAGKVYFLTSTNDNAIFANCIDANNVRCWSLELPEARSYGQLSLGNDGTLFVLSYYKLYAIGAP